MFQHTAARRRLAGLGKKPLLAFEFQHTAARRRLAKYRGRIADVESFNTQPPEGGWRLNQPYAHTFGCFNTQPPEGGWDVLQSAMDFYFVSTHSRPKAAGTIIADIQASLTRFNTQPPEGGWKITQKHKKDLKRFNTQPPEGGWSAKTSRGVFVRSFQHTAARRRLGPHRLW